MIYFKMKLLCCLIVCVVIFDDCLAYSRHQEAHNHKKDTHGHKLHYSSVKMPSGELEYFTTPYKCSRFKCGDRAKRILLSSHGKMGNKEYYAVKREVMAGASSDVTFQISKIEKIINPCLWSKYWYRKQQVRIEANETNEIMLFYYAPAPNKNIINSGFDERRAEMGVYGAGLYFSTKSMKAHENSTPKPDGTTRKMLLCRVALGKSLETGATVRAHAPVGYQSVKGQNSEEYVIYRGEQAYPEYLITYQV